MFRYFKNQIGAASALSLMALLILSSTAAAYLVTSSNGLSRLTGFSYSENIQAKAAAEAGIRYVWMNAIENTDDNTRIWSTDKLTKSPIPVDNADANSPTFQVAFTQISTNLPSDVTSADSYYKVTSVGRAGNSKSVLEAYLLIPAPTSNSLATLVRNGRVSRNIDWSLSKDKDGNDVATAPNNSNYYQILFNDYDSVASRITYNYQINLKSITEGHSSDTGYGIYYLANGDPDNMSGYVLQYDPGLEPDQILVKKVVADENNSTQPWLNEIIDKGDPVTVYGNVYTKQGSTGNQSWQKTTAAADSWAIPKGKNWTNTIKNNQTDPSSFFKLEEETSDTNYQKDIMTVPISNVMDKLNEIGANDTTKNNKMLGQKHILTIDIQEVTVNHEKNFIHRIYIDGLEILRFIDRSTTNNFAKKPGSGRTGLRVWQASAEFSSLSSTSTSPIIIRSWDIPKT